MNNLSYLLKVALSRKPIEMIFSITFRCNSRCKMCSRWKIDTSKDELATDQIKLIIPQLKKFGIMIVNITGGEPLLRKDIFEILDALRDIDLRVVLTTNGILLNEEKIKKLIKYKNVETIISLDTIDRELYKVLRGVDALDIVLKNIRLIKKISPAYPLRIHAVFSKLNTHEFEGLVKFAKENDLRFSAMPYNYEMRYENKDKSIMYAKDDLIPLFKRLSSMTYLPYVSGFKIVYQKAIEWMRGEDIGRCNAGREVLYLHHDGKISICGEFPPIADLKKEDIKDIYNKKIAEPAKGCKKCFVGCYWGFAILKQNKISVTKELLFSKKLIGLFKKSRF